MEGEHTMCKFYHRAPSGCGLLIISAISAFIFAQYAAAQQETTVGKDFGVGARAMGMGGAFIGVADDFTALYWNPAGLSQIKKTEVFGALSHERFETKIEYFGTPDSTFVSSTQPNSFGVVIPVPTYRGGLAFAFGVNRRQSFDSSVVVKGFNEHTVAEDPEYGELYINESLDESGSIYSYDFGAAVDVAPGVSLGGKICYLNGSYDYDLKLDADDTKNLDPEISGLRFRDKTKVDYSGVEGKIGFLARLIGDKLRLGANIDVPLDFTEYRSSVHDSRYLYDNREEETGYDEGDLDYDIYQPFRFNGGVAICPFPGATIAADATYTDWTQTKYSEPPLEGVTNEDFRKDYRHTVRLSIGGEYAIPGAGLKLRGGYLLDPLPYVPEGNKVESDRRFVTAGIGTVLGEVLSLDLTYMRGTWKESIDSDNIKRDQNTNRVFLSMGYRF